MVSTEFICKCDKFQAWIREGEISKSCPMCGRKYKGVYKMPYLEAKEIIPKGLKGIVYRYLMWKYGNSARYYDNLTGGQHVYYYDKMKRTCADIR